jgi:hypothetical protein
LIINISALTHDLFSTNISLFDPLIIWATHFDSQSIEEKTEHETHSLLNYALNIVDLLLIANKMMLSLIYAR